MKKSLSLLLSFCICLTVVLSTLLFSGVQLVYASTSDELWLMTDYPYALSRGVKIACGEDETVTPYHYETGTAFLPMSALCAYQNASFTVNGDTVTVTDSGGTLATMTVGSTSWTNGYGTVGEFLLPVAMRGEEVYISILSAKDVFGLNDNFYNKDIGLVILSERSITADSGTPTAALKKQIDTFAAVLFDRPSADTVYTAIQNGAGVGTHPSLLADADKFAELRKIYNGEYALDRTGYAGRVQAFADACASAFDRFFIVNESTGEVEWRSEETRLAVWKQPYYIYFDTNGDGTLERLVGESSYSYYDAELGELVTLECGGSGRGDGYDDGGRSNVDTYTIRLREMAFAWQMTGDGKYADGFYMLAKELGEWEHWGEGHFLDCADGSVEFALGFDWIYHAFDDEPEKRDELAAILYEKGMHKGYLSAIYDGQSASYVEARGIHVSYTAGTGGWRTVNRDNNWQTVCGSGMIVSALALAGYDGYKDEAMEVIEIYLRSLEKCLLQYAPDGAYIESPGYWGYGTNTLCVTLAALDSTCGDTFGYENIIGLHDSFYYAVGIADSKYNMWNYHDSGAGRVDYKSFYFASYLFDDPMLASLRDTMLFESKGFGTTYMDVLYYDPALSEGAEGSVPLDFNFKGIDTAVFRSSWDPDGVYTGLHAGPSVVTHGDMDTGNFTLSMGGYNWVVEPGTENYNYPGFWNYNRYRLYGKGVEGHSTVVIESDPSIPYGQAQTSNTTSYPVINTYYADELGGYAITDMTVQDGQYCTSGKRGVLLTNSRSTVVLQDSITFSRPTTLTSVLSLSYARIEMQSDSRTAYLIAYDDSGDRIRMRITLLSDNDNVRLRSVTTGETVFPETITDTQNAEVGYEDMLLTAKPRLFIEAEDVTEYNVALVFEMMRDEAEVVGYEYVDMSEWTTCSDEWVKDANDHIVYPEERPVYKYNAGDFNRALTELSRAKTDAARGEVIRKYFVYTTDYDPDNATTVSMANQFLAYIEEYEAKIRLANELYKNLFVGTP